MQTILKHYNHICVPKYQLLGFCKKKLTFVQKSEDVLHAFTFKYSKSVPICSVEFGVFPLCMPQPFSLEAGGYELYKFVLEVYEKNSGWRFDPNSNDSMLHCIESISRTIDLFLLPFFDSCSNCKSALQELLRLEELFDCNRKKVLCFRGDSDSAKPWQERSLFDSRKYYMALKSHNTSYAQQYLNHQINFCKNQLKLLDDPKSPVQPEIVRERFSTNLFSYTEQLNRLNSGDFGYFDGLLSLNEKQTFEILAIQYPQIRGQ